MSGRARVVLRPLGAEIFAEPGAALADVLAAHGVEFPCGGRGRCRGCRLRVAEGSLPESPADLAQLSPPERTAGWRLACQARVAGDLVLELRQWSGLILADDTPFAFTPAEGLGIAADIGTTTLVAQLLDLATGRVLATQTALNPQARDGADVMSRLSVALAPGGLDRLQQLIRAQLARMVAALLAEAPGPAVVARATLVGNTAMHHLLLGLDVTSLATAPFVPAREEGALLTGRELGWPDGAAGAAVTLLPNLGGFVGSDILAVILATRLHEAEECSGAADLGTNGEIVVGDRRGLWVAST
ncbi:MAG: 2Fe-2S iron-sulfur cluster-binding protein, partial [bacterium]